MTFDEIQATIEQMLSVQRELQESQLRLLVAQKEQSKMIDRLIGYSLSNETDHLDLQERMNQLEERMRGMGR
jgi:hypothetical protein